MFRHAPATSHSDRFRHFPRLVSPAPFYTDPKVLAEESERIFPRSWQAVGHRGQLANPGDYFTTETYGRTSCCWCAEPKPNCAAFTTFAGIAPGPQRRMRFTQAFSLRLSRLDLRPGRNAHQCPRIRRPVWFRCQRIRAGPGANGRMVQSDFRQPRSRRRTAARV